MTGSGRLLTDSSILYRCSQKYYDKVLSDFQLGSGQLPFLIFIYENEGITMNGLAQMGCYDKGTVTKGVQRLEEAGYVTSEVSPQDKRVRFLKTTEKAKEIIARIYLIRQNWWETITQGMSEQEAAQLGQLQERAANNALSYLQQQQQRSEVRIFGLQKMTLLDYPGKIAATLFTGGCNFRCPYCQNSDLVFLPEDASEIPQTELMQFLEKRQGLLEGVCISGGEPLIHPGLDELLRQIRKLGYPVKLDTNGSFPDKLKQLIDEGLVDYVAMDLKNCRERYGETAGVSALECARIEQSVQILMEDQVPYEFRTTVVRQLHDERDIERIGQWVQGARKLVLQQFVDSERVICPGLQGYSRQEMERFREILLPWVANTEIRGC